MLGVEADIPLLLTDNLDFIKMTTPPSSGKLNSATEPASANMTQVSHESGSVSAHRTLALATQGALEIGICCLTEI